MSELRRKFSLVVTLLAWLCANGSQWDLVQVFAWARMFTANVQVLPLREAVVRTLSPEGRCQLCEAVTAAKQQQEDPGLPAPKFTAKILLGFEPTPTFAVEEPPFAGWAAFSRSMRSIERPCPPVPPPRA